MALTKHQIQAIETTGKNILVSAGAGSGKTTVLTQRVLQKLRSGIRIDQLVILTFTDAAADEMRERIQKGIDQDSSLSNQKEYLDQAIISTFDSFCLRLVKTYHERLNLPSDVTICDGVRYDMLKNEALKETIQAQYVESSEDFRHLVSLLFDKGDRRLFEAIQTWITELDLIVDEEAYLENYFDLFDSKSARSNVYDAFKDVIKQYADEASFELNLLREALPDSQSVKVENWIHEWIRLFTPLCDMTDVFAWLQHLNQSKAPRKIVLKEDDFDKPMVDRFHDAFKESLNKAQKSFSKLKLTCETDMQNDFDENHRIVGYLIPVMKEYVRRRKTLSRSRNQFGFSDITRFAIQLLQGHDDVAASLRQRFREIMVDEYQDTNDLQNALIERLSHNNLFLVGDIKQSIYAFRNANPRNFLAKYKQYSKGNGGMKIDLLENFRSRKTVLDDINELFLPLMDEEVGGIDYADSQALVYGNMIYELLPRNDHLRLHLVDSETIPENIDETSAQVRIIIDDIQQKLREHALTVDLQRNQLRELEYRDFCVLVDRKTAFDDFEREFVASGIPVRKHAKEAFTSTEEMLFLQSLVHLMVCRSDLEEHRKHFRTLFYAVAHSFVYRHTDEDIVLFLHQCDDTSEDWIRLSQTDLFLPINQLIVDASKMSFRSSMYETMCYIVENSQLIEAISYLDNSTSRSRKVAYFLKKIATFEDMSWMDLIEYFTYLRSSDELDMDYTEPKEFANEVQLMSMHKSKGLEFPICYYPNLHKKFRFEENKSLFVYDRSYGLFCKLFDGGVHESMLHVLTKNNAYREMVSERMRLLYVALTRAKEEIHFLSTTKQIERSRPLYRQNPIPKMTRQRATSFLDFITMHPTMDHYEQVVPISESSHAKTSLKEKSYPTPIKAQHFEYVPQKRVHSNYAKAADFIDSISEWNELEEGTKLHAFLESIDFTNPQVALEKASALQKTVYNHLISLFEPDFFTNGILLHEYPFVIVSNQETLRGIIDMVIVKESEVFILDFKLMNIDDEAYVRQLQGYRKAMRQFTDKPIRSILISLLGARKKEIFDEL